MLANAPFNEAQRLRALQDLGLLDTAADERFDRLTRAAADMLDCPIASLVLVDEQREWGKSAFGLPYPKFQDVPRAQSFSTHAILTLNEPFIVPDASKDPRFVRNPLVIGPPFVRFYAGYPILVHGVPVGVLSAVDHTPRTVSEKQLGDLAFLAAQADLLLDLQAATRRIGEAADRDAITGLGNDRLFMAKLQEFVASGSCGLLSVEIEDFKSIVFDHGPVAYKAALQDAARRLRSATRAGDVMARVGSGRFAVLVPQFGDANELDLLAKRILEAFRSPLVYGEFTLPLMPAIGIAVCPDDSAIPSSLLRDADEALRDARSLGHGQPNRSRRVGDLGGGPRSMERDLLQAAQKGEFVLHWQPIVDLRSNKLHGYEAFLRWNHPVMGEIPPHRFLPIAERSGLMRDIDLWALRDACRQAATWEQGVKVAVNISAAWSGSKALPEAIAAILAEHSLAASRLELDIPEGFLTGDADDVAEKIRQLKQVGVSLTLDDFGTGSSSLSSLKNLAFDKIKLHASFTRDLRTNPRAAVVADASIALGRSLRITVSAEGVEELWHLDFLRRHGCDLAQGYLFGRPSAVPQLPGLIDAPLLANAQPQETVPFRDDAKPAPYR